MKNLDKQNSHENMEAEAIRKLESFSSIDSQDKLLLLAVYLDLKPMSELHLSSKNKDQDSIEDEFKDIIEKMKLFYKISHSIRKDRVSGLEIPVTNFFVTKDKTNLDDEKIGTEDYKKLGFEQYHLKLGKDFGFPETAIKGFITHEVLDRNDFPTEITDEDRKFMFFALSKNNWKEEIKWLREIEDGVKNISPVIYEQIVSRKMNFI